ncbi:MAG: hypothetical protein HY675_19640 [Chloroflexi bacterium]|nr:hypothetical protein [Chloroflexota bacterium]
MPLWLSFLFLALALGLATNRAGTREPAIILSAAAVLAMAYFTVPRLM